MSLGHTSRSSSLIWMLAALIAIGPLAVDAYLPAMPDMARDLNTSIHHVEFSLSFFLIAFGLGQLIGGPLSDQFGRRTTISWGLAMFSLGSLLAIFTPSIEILWLARLLQALGGGLGVVNTMGVIRDLYSGKESTRALSRVISIMMAAPLLAPFLGSGLLLISNWRSIFVFLLAYALLLLLVLLRALPETRRASAKNVEQGFHPFKRYGSVMRHPMALGYLFSTAFSQAGMFAFITGAALIYMEYYGASAQVFPILFGMNILTLMLFNRVNLWLLNHREPITILRGGQALQLTIGALLVACFAVFDLPLYAVVAGIMLFIGLHGLIMSNGISSAVDYFPESAATASALMTASGFIIGALAGGLVGLLGDGSPLPTLVVMACCPLLGILLRRLCHAFARPHHLAPETQEEATNSNR